ncbi:MAG: hypothetical protein QOJ19_248, partial [Acidimicrobiia bacterium]|nr:hypothetical protein [Acidimicrobiia bacterium]
LAPPEQEFGFHTGGTFLFGEWFTDSTSIRRNSRRYSMSCPDAESYVER